MPEFLAETYAPRGGPGTAAPGAAEAALAADQASQPGGPVRLLGAIFVPEEETCFWLYQAPSAGTVRAAMTRAGLRPDRITAAAWTRPPRGPVAGHGQDRPGQHDGAPGTSEQIPPRRPEPGRFPSGHRKREQS